MSIINSPWRNDTVAPEATTTTLLSSSTSGRITTIGRQQERQSPMTILRPTHLVMCIIIAMTIIWSRWRLRVAANGPMDTCLQLINARGAETASQNQHWKSHIIEAVRDHIIWTAKDNSSIEVSVSCDPLKIVMAIISTGSSLLRAAVSPLKPSVVGACNRNKRAIVPVLSQLSLRLRVSVFSIAAKALDANDYHDQLDHTKQFIRQHNQHNQHRQDPDTLIMVHHSPKSAISSDWTGQAYIKVFGLCVFECGRVRTIIKSSRNHTLPELLEHWTFQHIIL